MSLKNIEDVSNGLFGWYPMKKKSKLLCFGKCGDAGYFSEKCETVSIICASDEERIFCEKRYWGFNNIRIIDKDIFAYSEISEEKFSYIFYNWTNTDKLPENKERYHDLLFAMKKLLSEDGVILLCVPNRFGAKYMCGAPDPILQEPFIGICDDTSCRTDCDELRAITSKCGFKNISFHYPYPKNTEPTCIYSDKVSMGYEVFEKMGIITEEIGGKVMNEDTFTRAAARNRAMNFFSNSIIAEISDMPCCDIIYSSITSKRRSEKAFFTNVHDGGTVTKIPMYESGKKTLEDLVSLSDELAQRGIPVVIIKEKNGIGIMDRVNYPTLSDHLREIIKIGEEDIIPWLDKVYDIILRSSDKSNKLSELFKKIPSDIDIGIVQKKAFIEILPVNIFVGENELILFDQERVLENAPALFVMYRCIHDLMLHIPEFSQNYNIDTIKRHFGLERLWGSFLIIEGMILNNEYLSEQYVNILKKIKKYNGFDQQIINRNRNYLKMNYDTYEKIETPDNDAADKLFDPLFDIGDKKIVLFGAGKYADCFLEKYGKNHPPIFIIDNSVENHGKNKNGIEIKSPEALRTLERGTFRAVIAILDWRPVSVQLEKMGYSVEDYRVFNRQVDMLLPMRISNTLVGGKYNIGYIPGAFDLFHIGHLNILRRSKECCNYLIAGVINDDVIRKEKFKEPIIPFEERLEIVKQCKYVDLAVGIDLYTANKLNAWKEFRYSCLFSGTDHVEHYDELRKQLRTLGSDLVFFPYTQGTSSSILGNILRGYTNEK